MKILLVLDKCDDRGSIHAAANYVRTGDELGHHIAIFGRDEASLAGLRFATKPADFDYVIFVVESQRHWMSGLRMSRFLTGMPRERRAILDADGMYNPLVCVDSYDRNHLSEQDRSQWMAHYRSVADKIMQPTFHPLRSDVLPLPFYGYDPSAASRPGAAAKQFDVLLVGHNWWRWREVNGHLLPAIQRMRAKLDGVCFVGAWWDAPPPWAEQLGLGAAFQLDPDRLRELRVTVRPPVRFSDVIPTMDTARVNVMTQRPLFRRLRFLTSKYFEILSADTIPLVMLDPDHAQSVYGPAGRELALPEQHEQISDKLDDVLNHPAKYREIVAEVRRHVTAHHSYRNRVEELVTALRTKIPTSASVMAQ